MIYCVRFGDGHYMSFLGYYGSLKGANEAIRKYNKTVDPHYLSMKDGDGKNFSGQTAEHWGRAPTPKTKKEIITLLGMWGNMAHD